MIRQVLGLVVLGSLLTAGCSGTSATGGLAGTSWTAESAEKDGQPAGSIKGHKIDFTRDTFTIYDKDGKVLYKGTYQVTAVPTPATIDFLHTEGDLKDRTWQGIYQIEGSTLTICDNAGDLARPRPTAFTAGLDSGHVLVKFKQVEKKSMGY